MANGRGKQVQKKQSGVLKMSRFLWEVNYEIRTSVVCFMFGLLGFGERVWLFET